MIKVYIDFETKSTADLRKVGAWRYAEHPLTDINCICFTIDGSGYVATLAADQIDFTKYGNGEASSLRHLAEDESAIFIAHNAAFEQAIWAEIMVKRYGFPPIPRHRWRDTMAKCYAHHLPGALKDAARILKLQSQKDMDGRDSMLRLSRPRGYSLCAAHQTKSFTAKGIVSKPCCGEAGLVWWTEETAPEDFEKLYEYCRQDIAVTIELDSELLDLSPIEQRLWVIDQRINQEGIYIDLRAVRQAQKIIDIERSGILQDFQRATGVAFSPTQRAVFHRWMHEQGYAIPNTQKATLDALAEEENLPEKIKVALDLMGAANKSSLAKYAKFLERCREDGLLREEFAYHGAHTGRWTGRGVQIQNLARPIGELLSDAIIWAIGLGYEGFNTLYGGDPE